MNGHLLRSQSLGKPHVLLCTLRLSRSGRLTDSAARTGVGAPYSSHRAHLWPCILAIPEQALILTERALL